jgi:hypothetical protein
MDWSKDRARQLRKRAIAEDISDQQQLQAASKESTKLDARPSKASLRAIGEDAVSSFSGNHHIAWKITCEICGHQGDVNMDLPVPSIKALRCTKCDHRQWLSQKAMDAPWDA